MTSRYTILHVCPCPSILSPEDPAYIMLRLCAVVLDMGSRRPVIAWCSTYLCVKIGTTHVADSMAAAVSEGVTCLLQWLQYAIWERHKVRTVRRTLAQIAEQGSLDSSGNLSIDGQHIAVCYYRAGYAPDRLPLGGRVDREVGLFSAPPAEPSSLWHAWLSAHLQRASLVPVRSVLSQVQA